MVATLKFTNANRSQFFATVRKRVDAYFVENEISPNANVAMWAKATFFLVGYLALYGLIISNQFDPGVMLTMALFLGAFGAFIGFNVAHDAVHGAFSKHTWLNRVLGYSFYMLGASPYVWRIMHNVVHHTYTNIPGHDEDIDVAPGLIRLDPCEEARPWQQFQHLYAFPLYGLTSLSWVFRKDFKKLFKDKIGQYDNTSHARREYVKLFVTKATYYVFFLIIPIAVLDLAWWQVLLGFVAMHIVEGLVLGLVFQLAHVVEGTTFPVPTDSGNIEEAWAVHQLRTTANFAPRSAVAAFFCGGLNRQIEHHLFPKICHIHYPAITKIVKQTAHEFNLPYIESPTFFLALQSHYSFLKRMGRTPQTLPYEVEYAES